MYLWNFLRVNLFRNDDIIHFSYSIWSVFDFRTFAENSITYAYNSGKNYDVLKVYIHHRQPPIPPSVTYRQPAATSFTPALPTTTALPSQQPVQPVVQPSLVQPVHPVQRRNTASVSTLSTTSAHSSPPATISAASCVVPSIILPGLMGVTPASNPTPPSTLIQWFFIVEREWRGWLNRFLIHPWLLIFHVN